MHTYDPNFIENKHWKSRQQYTQQDLFLKDNNIHPMATFIFK